MSERLCTVIATTVVKNVFDDEFLQIDYLFLFDGS